MSDKKEEKKENGKSGSHSDNDLSKVQKVMKDNNIPLFFSNEEENETEDSE